MVTSIKAYPDWYSIRQFGYSDAEESQPFRLFELCFICAIEFPCPVLGPDLQDISEGPPCNERKGDNDSMKSINRE